jgi:hypothetical protein
VGPAAAESRPPDDMGLIRGHARPPTEMMGAAVFQFSSPRGAAPSEAPSNTAIPAFLAAPAICCRALPTMRQLIGQSRNNEIERGSVQPAGQRNGTRF